MSKISLSNIPQIPIEQMIALPIENLLELSRDANNALIEAKGQKNWIDGVIDLKNLVNDSNNNYGGRNEQITDY